MSFMTITEKAADFCEDVGDFIVGVAESADWFVRKHPLLTLLLFVILFFGGCEIAFKIHIVSSQTKLMPY